MGLDLLAQRFRSRAFASLKVRFCTESFQTAAVFAASFTTPMMTPVFLGGLRRRGRLFLGGSSWTAGGQTGVQGGFHGRAHGRFRFRGFHQETLSAPFLVTWARSVVGPGASGAGMFVLAGVVKWFRRGRALLFLDAGQKRGFVGLHLAFQSGEIGFCVRFRGGQALVWRDASSREAFLGTSFHFGHCTGVFAA